MSHLLTNTLASHRGRWPGLSIWGLLCISAIAFASPVVDLNRTEIPFSYAPLVVSDTDIYDVPYRALIMANLGSEAYRIDEIAIDGPNVSDFALFQSLGFCVVSLKLEAGEKCRLGIAFSPSAPGLREARLRIRTSADATERSVRLYGYGAAPSVTSASLPRFYVFESEFYFFGGVGRTEALQLGNASTIPLTISSISITGLDAARFAYGGMHPGFFGQGVECVQGQSLAPGAGCHLQVAFSPGAAGRYSAQVAFQFAGYPAPYELHVTAYVDTPLTYAKSSTVSLRYAFEYYHAQFDHYFMTANEFEIGKLAWREIRGWAPTGRSFKTYVAESPGTSPVCRFYIPPAFGDSHFYSASPAECSEVRAKFPNLVYESAMVMHAVLPDLTSGVCPANTNPVYRLWNQRSDSNHRYTTDRAQRGQMLVMGYLAEGYGPEGVAMCAPS